MTPPAAKVEWLRLRVRLVRRQTLQRIERAIFGIAFFAGLLWLVTRFLWA